MIFTMVRGRERGLGNHGLLHHSSLNPNLDLGHDIYHGKGEREGVGKTWFIIPFLSQPQFRLRT
jgi:hypothetical protein